MTDAPEPPSAPPPEPPPPAPEQAPAAASPQRPPWLPIAIGVAAAVILGLGFLAYRSLSGGAAEDAYTVEAYTPPTELITASEGVTGYEAPDATSAQAVTFGAGVTLNVTGRLSRGLGGDWYAVGWNNRTVFVRQSDAVAGAGAPPPVEVREDEPDEEEVKEDEKPDLVEDPEEEEVAEGHAPTWGLEISDVSWVREPSSRDFARYFPRRALDQGQSGRVTLDCVIAGNGGLNCSVAQESPSGFGFGDAALSIARNARVRPTLPDGSPAGGRHLRLPLSFRAG